ncbi:histidine-rich glycoprotein [Drosophila sulfurigaster albostrigata]|uniref:histidine-rich glycoprotein n=1 Tax=Drosophila sulfurigaster albostrigata TaxID=89887 RepID=UPI002D2189BA|nr:histidine-rich glycoprotein [Drosophila sulfurigaster albostrigata]
MQFALLRALFGCAFLVSLLNYSLAKQVQQSQPQPQQQSQGVKLKRDAALSFGSGSGLYHGPSHKYLPPPAGYESTYGSLHGNGLASSSGFDFASLLDSDNTHHFHHYHQQSPQSQSHHQSSSYHHAPAGHRPIYLSSSGSNYHHHHQQQPQQRPHQAPKVETYIVQTSHAPGPQHHHHHQQQQQQQGHGLGYKYSGHGSNFLSLLSGNGGHKQSGGSTYLLATRPSLSFAPSLSHGLEQEQEHTAGYSYEAPSVQHFKQQPLTSYGVPLLPGYEADDEQQSHQEHVQSSAHKSQLDQHQPPAYALGHKGLGHFSYTSSKPLALNTDIHQHHHQQQQQQQPEHNELAPFKPSAFLGAKHEPSNAFDFATPTSQYLQPPTGGASGSGYDYAAPSVLYGAPGQSGDSATPIFEPESTYLPPVTSYGAPLATPTHSYH